VNIGILLPLILIVGVMYMMTRSAKNKQRQAADMRSQLEPGAGVRTIGGMYAVVKEVGDETVLLEITDGVHAHFAKSAVGTVLSEDEFNRIVHGIEPEDPEDADDSDDSQGASSAAEDEGARPNPVEDGEQAAGEHVSLDKSADEVPEQDGSAPAEAAREHDGSAAK
jgi:preprotein translocase subunit YajC